MMRIKTLLCLVLAVLPLVGMWKLEIAGKPQARGQRVPVKTETGAEVLLYAESHALVIGVSEYQRGTGWGTLPGVKDDVPAVRSALEHHGFQVEVVLNPTGSQLRQALNQFAEDWGFAEGNRLVVYFAGHGYTGKTIDGREMGYIVPQDAPNPDQDNARFNKIAVSMKEIMNIAERVQAKHALFVFDSCFSGTLFKTRERVSPAIVQKTARPVREFITAGTAKQAVPDQSQFRRQFVGALTGSADTNRDGYVTASELGTFLEEKVTDYSNGAQTPQWGKINNPDLNEGDMVFALPKRDEASNPEASPKVPTAAELEAQAWNEVKDSRRIKDLEAFLQEYGNGAYAPLARVKLAKLKGESEPLPVSPPVKPALVTGSRAQFGGMEFVYIQAGSFDMGSNTGEGDEKPVHRVTLSQNFWLAKYEVTQGEWEAVMGRNPSQFKGNAKLPVEQVSWNDVQKFIKKLNEREGREVYRLPSEAEWEYACRAGISGDYAGNLDAMGWYDKNAGGKTHPVGEKVSNGWGLYDMHGNVSEWCGDWYDSSYYQKSPSEDPKGPSGGSFRVVRGGCWGGYAVFCRSADRGLSFPGYRNDVLGFRLVRKGDR